MNTVGNSTGAQIQMNAITSGASTKTTYMQIAHTADNPYTGALEGAMLFKNATGYQFGSTAAHHMTITSGGLVGIGTATPGSSHAKANKLVVGSGSACGIGLLCGTAEGWFAFSRGNTNDTDAFDGGMSYSSRELKFHTNAGTTRLTIGSDGAATFAGGVSTSDGSIDTNTYTSNKKTTFYVGGQSDRFYKVKIPANWGESVILYRQYSETIGTAGQTGWNSSSSTHFGALTLNIPSFQTNDWGGHSNAFYGTCSQKYTNVIARAGCGSGVDYAHLVVYLRGGSGGSGVIYHVKTGNQHSSAPTVDLNTYLSSPDAAFNFAQETKIVNPHQHSYANNSTFSLDLSVGGTKNFRISHPLPSKKDTHELVHSSVEAPKADLIYRGKVQLESGSATINIDTHAGMTEGTFVLLCDDVQCFTSNETTYDPVKGSISGNELTITCKNSSSTATVSWMVIGDRKDQKIINSDSTDENGKIIVEPEKEALENA